MRALPATSRRLEIAKARLILWSLALAAILGFGWHKSVENLRDYERHSAWMRQIDQLQAEAFEEHERLQKWVKNVYDQQAPRQPNNPRQQIAARFNEGRPLQTQTEGNREVARWKHPKYGFELRFYFDGDRLSGSGGQIGRGQLESAYPEPPLFAETSWAESIRRSVARWGGWLWLAILPVALLSRRYGRIAAEAMLAVSLAWGVAHLVVPRIGYLVIPNLSLTPRGMLLNKALPFAASAILVSVVALAVRLAMGAERPLKLQFGLRMLLGFTALVAIFLVIGPFGHIALTALLIGAGVFLATLRGCSHWFWRHNGRKAHAHACVQ